MADELLPVGQQGNKKRFVETSTPGVVAELVAVWTQGSTEIIGNVRIDQTTPGTTNGVVVNASLPAGVNNIGDVDVLTEPSGSGQYTTPAHTAPTMGVATAVALASNASRLYAMLVNDSDTAIYIKLGAAAVLNQGIRLAPNGGWYEMSKKAGNLYTGAINGISSAASKVLLVTEGV